MKNCIFCVFVLFVGFSFSCNNVKKEGGEDSEKTVVFDEDLELAAIMKVIENETKCFFEGNYECWASNWSHAEYAMQAWNNSDGTSDAAVSWEAINKQGKSWIETYYENGKNVIHPDFIATKPTVKFFGTNAAYLIWRQYNADSEKKYYRVSQETRLMEKESDGWKIVNVSAFWDVAPKVAADSIPDHLN